MENTNTINTENILPKLKTPVFFKIIMGLIIFLIIVMFLIMFDVNLSIDKPSKSQEQTVNEIFIILFFSLLIIGLCVLFLPNIKDLKTLFGQISNVTYVIGYTIFFILFYTMTSTTTLNTYSYIINAIMLCLGIYVFFKSASHDYTQVFNINYERIKMLILLFCFITLMITFYNINPGDAATTYFGTSMLITILITVFAFLYLIILLLLNPEQNASNSNPNPNSISNSNFLTNFSSFGVYSSIAFIIFIVIITILISSDKHKFFQNKFKSSSVIILVLLICVFWSILLGVNLFDNSTNTNTNLITGKMHLFKKGLLVLFGLVISGLLIFWISTSIENLSGNSSIISFILNLLIVIIVLGLIYKTINVKLPAGNSKKNSFFTLITNVLLYIPCIASGMFDKLGGFVTNQYNETNSGSVMMLIFAITLLIVYFKTQSIANLISSQGGNQLVNNPVDTDTLYNLGSYQSLNGGSDAFDYKYAISCWIFLNASTPSTTSSSNTFTSILNFGNKPNVLYNVKTNTLMITMQQKNLKDITKNKLIDFDENGNRIIYVDKNVLLQKWNNLIINYNGGTLDIFMNGKLVKSSIEVVPYYSLDNLTIGENDGIKGGICNVVYFRHALNSKNIYYVYNSVKHLTPPVFNNKNETILVKN